MKHEIPPIILESKLQSRELMFYNMLAREMLRLDIRLDPGDGAMPISS
jgi:hypothetical protein